MIQWMRRLGTISLWLLLVGLLAGGCSQTTKKGIGEACQDTTECADNLVCQAQVCAEASGEFSGEASAENADEFSANGEEPEPTQDKTNEPASSETSGEATTDVMDAGGSSEGEPGENNGGADESGEVSAPEGAGESLPETSTERPLPPTGMFFRCAVSNACNAGLQCIDGFCVKSCYPYSDPLDCPAPAFYACSSKNVCLLRCRDSSGQDNTLLCPEGMRCASGICTPGATAPQGSAKEGDSCKPGDCDGSLGLVCLPGLGSCVKACDPRTAAAGNPSCSANEECVLESRFSLAAFSPLQGVCAPKASKKSGEPCNFFAQRCGGNLRCISMDATSLCRAECDLKNGAALNPACNRLEYCEGQGLTYPNGICRPLPPRTSTGTKGIGVACAPGECDRSKFLFCDVVENQCAKVCSPKDGVTRNNLCATNEVCIEERSYNLQGTTQSFLGGRCAPPANRNLGETCDAITHRCRSGLACYGQRCHKVCDLSKGATKNPDCPTQADHGCASVRDGLALCRVMCNPTQGLADNPSCPVGQYCDCLGGRCCVGGACPSTAYCTSSNIFSTGTKRLGESCSDQDPQRRCDSSQSLFCRMGQCETACDPRKGRTGNPNCSPSQECVTGLGITESSPFQGVCETAGTKKEGESCSSTSRCADGLVCVAGSCEKACDPSQGVVANATCAFTHYCNETLGAPQGGACTPLPQGQIGKREEGKPCTNSFSFRNKSCDKSKSLACDENQGICVKACQPRDGETSNPKCSTGEECVEDIQSFLGGVCVAPASRKLGEWCNSTSARCVSGALCVSGLCQAPCDPSQGTTSNPDCPGSSYRCQQLPGFGKATQGVCVNTCNPSVGVAGNSACNARQICVAESGSQTVGLCTPVAAPNNGPLALNQSCNDDDPDLQCGAKLVCASFSFGQRCTSTCDRKQGQTACNTVGWVCLASTRSSTGGYCSPPQ